MSDRATCHDHDQYYWLDDGCPVCNAIAELATKDARIADLTRQLAEARDRALDEACSRVQQIKPKFDNQLIDRLYTIDAIRALKGTP